MRASITSLVALGLVVGCGGDSTAPFSESSSSSTGPTSGAGGDASGAGGGATNGSGGSSGPSTGSGGSGGAVSVTCPDSPLPAGETQLTIQHDGNEREYEVQVPASYDNSQPVALVIDMHGYTSSKDQQQSISGWSELAETEGFVVVRPNGFGAVRSWNAGDFCCGTAQNQELDDVGLMKAIVAEVSDQLCIDDKRVYASGLSNGGAMSHRLACEAADVFAAVAPVSYPIDFDPFSQCQPSRPIAVMHSHGTSDLIVPYDGSVSAASTPESFAYWATADGCSGDPVETHAAGDSHCDTYQACTDGVEVTLCTIDGGHVLYTNADDVPIAALAWDFFKKHPLP